MIKVFLSLDRHPNNDTEAVDAASTAQSDLEASSYGRVTFNKLSLWLCGFGITQATRVHLWVCLGHRATVDGYWADMNHIVHRWLPPRLSTRGTHCYNGTSPLCHMWQATRSNALPMPKSPRGRRTSLKRCVQYRSHPEGVTHRH